MVIPKLTKLAAYSIIMERITLKHGDTVAIVATARKVIREELNPAIEFLEGNGFQVILGPHLFEEDHQYAGTDELRVEALQWAIDHPEVKMIWCARGGYGTMRLMDKINLTPLVRNPKILAGFSDITVLHSALNNMRIPSLHSTMPLSWPTNTPETHQSQLDAITGKPLNFKTEAHEFNKAGRAKAELVGGNLSLLYALSGTPFKLDTAGKILFIEDLDEYLYHIDRMMLALKMSGALTNLAGLVVGGMSDMRDNAIPFGKSALETIRDTVAEYNYPVCFNFPCGHIDDNRSLWFGLNYELEVSEGGGKLDLFKGKLNNSI